jgi:hypothetical protein
MICDESFSILRDYALVRSFRGHLTQLVCDINMAMKKSTAFVLFFTTVKSAYNSQRKSCCETSRGCKQT